MPISCKVRECFLADVDTRVRSPVRLPTGRSAPSRTEAGPPTLVRSRPSRPPLAATSGRFGRACGSRGPRACRRAQPIATAAAPPCHGPASEPVVLWSPPFITSRAPPALALHGQMPLDGRSDYINQKPDLFGAGLNGRPAPPALGVRSQERDDRFDAGRRLRRGHLVAGGPSRLQGVSAAVRAVSGYFSHPVHRGLVEATVVFIATEAGVRSVVDMPQISARRREHGRLASPSVPGRRLRGDERPQAVVDTLLMVHDAGRTPLIARLLDARGFACSRMRRAKQGHHSPRGLSLPCDSPCPARRAVVTRRPGAWR